MLILLKQYPLLATSPQQSFLKHSQYLHPCEHFNWKTWREETTCETVSLMENNNKIHRAEKRREGVGWTVTRYLVNRGSNPVTWGNN